ncbi:heparinase II/III family protein [Cohnella sp.]|uniref:heparinase II/III domain-containing protein n=1 Tax=Cohnella sp. TaxID=1883426 RepID=UPI0035695BC5
MNKGRTDSGLGTWFTSAVAKLKEELRGVLKNGVAIPDSPGGWWHEYVCPDHHTELLFDPEERDARAFRCPYGCELAEERYRGAWLVFRHQENARIALSAAAIYSNTGETEYGELASGIVERYASAYDRYPVNPDAQPWMLRGRIFHQALTEAIWATSLLRTMLLLREASRRVDPDQAEPPLSSAVSNFLERLAKSMDDYRQVLIHERQEPQNNYTAWLNACLAGIYAVRGDAEGMNGLLECPGGLRHHLSIGVRPDQLEFEGSTYYHIFVLRAYLIAAEMAEHVGMDLYGLRGEAGQTYRGMLMALVDLAAPNGALPALHDGPYRRVPFARETAEIFEIGWSKYVEPKFLPILKEAYRDIQDGEPRREGLEAVLFGKGDWDFTDSGLLENPAAPPASSRLFPDSGFAVGRQEGNPLSFLIDYGPHGGSHGHYDKLNLVLMHAEGFLAPDRGMVPYGSKLRQEWFSQTASHNTVTVGRRSQEEDEGACVAFRTFSDGSAYVWTRSEGAYEGAVLDRHLYLTSRWLLDWFTVKLDREDTVDWWLHNAVPAVHPFPAAHPLSDDVTGNVLIPSDYPCVEYKSKIIGHKHNAEALPLRLIANGGERKEGAIVSASLLLFPNSELYELEAPGTAHDPSKTMRGIMHRQNGRLAHFVCVYGTTPAPLALKWSSPSESGLAGVEIGEGDEAELVRLSDSGLVVGI